MATTGPIVMAALCIVLVEGEEEIEAEHGEGPVCEEEPHHLTKGIQISKLSKVREEEG